MVFPYQRLSRDAAECVFVWVAVRHPDVPKVFDVTPDLARGEHVIDGCEAPEVKLPVVVVAAGRFTLERDFVDILHDIPLQLPHVVLG